MTIPNSQDSEQIDALAEEFSRALRDGQRPSVEAFVSKCTSIDKAEELRELLANIQLLEELKQPPQIDVGLPADLDGLDDYTLVREIGRGGMGIVYEAVHRSLGRRVAIKVLAGRELDEPKRLARFRVEARAAARLRHPHIVPVFGIGNQDSVHYYVMDYVRGRSLREILSDDSGVPTVSGSASGIADSAADCGFSLGETSPQPALTVADTVASTPLTVSAQPGEKSYPFKVSCIDPGYQQWAAGIARDLSDALTYAHAQNVLHRDIKPANILIDESGQCWLADFGLAKLTDNEALTQTGDQIGTPQYMPPESFHGKYDARSEIYAVGLTLYEMLTLEAAVQGGSSAEVLRRAAESSITPVGKRNRSLPQDLATIVDKCLAAQPDQRYAAASDLRDDLNRFLAQRPIKAKRSGPLRRLILWGR
ncbi:MAG TPA: serine/threonine protein kinase, partial [Planctomycetaceae bacterium]|nr:serine/threonine protein kinase [Planctomycetaceae bacterium]